MTAFLRPDNLSGSRTFLTYLALLAGIVTFLPGSTYLATIFSGLAIALGWGNLRTVARAIFGLILVLAGIAIAFEPAAIERASGNMAQIGRASCRERV